MKMTVRKQPLDERQSLVVRLHGKEGQTYAAIAAQLGVSSYRVRQIYTEARVRLKDFARKQEDSLLLLPARARKILTRYRITNRAQARKCIQQGRLSWDAHGGVCWEGMGLRDAGWKCWVAINEWAGLPRPKPQKWIVCPHCGTSFEP